MTLVGRKSGRKKIIWSQLWKLTLLMVSLSTAATSLAYLAFAGQWNPLAAWLGVAGGGSIMLIILIVNYCTPAIRLPYIR